MTQESPFRKILPVIGEQMAQARRAEQARLSNSTAESRPMPANLRYNAWLGDLDLSDPERSPLDDELITLCQSFTGSDPTSRSQFRDSASMDDFYTLLAFGRRSAVFAMRDRETERIVDGFTAIAMIERRRIDSRDALAALSLLNYSGGVVGANMNDLFGKAASLAEPKMSELILGFQEQSEEYRDIRKSWGYAMVETKAGRGFVGSSFNSYQPTYPLDQAALELAQLVKRDRYGPASITLASNLPAVWLSSIDDNELKRALTSVRGVVTIRTDLRPQESPDYKHQALMIFLAELDDETSARSLLRMSQEKQTRPNDFAIAGIQEGRLFCLVVGRSTMVGQASHENQSSIQRFSGVIAEVLKRLT